ncbi:ABC transporter ATP-binding protein [Companilactobacillus sp. HBUAS59544]|uniref:ABC transporter ATP-binding protein n=1 Tax=Companilactobacillus sp. HBUAS59544 TaxID=3109363 RepID=UPI002FEF8A59
MSIVLQVDHLNKSYREKTILKDISFHLEDSSVVALIGVNGAGKTTLINTILELIPKDSGTIHFSIKNWRQITGVMMQDNLILNRIRVKEIINLTRSYFKTPLSYNTLIDLSGLKESQNTFINQLSGGQKRRLSFVLALAGNPEILFLDEPTVGMDSIARQDFWKSIAKLKRTGKTIFVTSHYLEELENIADQILILEDKTLTFNGSLKQLRETSRKVLIEFDSQLSIKIFNELASIVSVEQINQHYQIITNDVKKTISELSPFLQGIENLKINQSSLNSIILNYQEKR